MESYVPLHIKRFPQTKKTSPEALYWKSFKSVEVPKQSASITHLSFCPSKPHDLVVSSAPRVITVDHNSGNVKKTISRFKDVAYSGNFRHDGQLIVAGCEDSSIQVFDAKSRVVLRTFEGHKGAVRLTKFASDDTSIISASDDRTLRRWDLPSKEQVGLMTGHGDYVRCASESLSDPSLWISGSYDHTIKCWDTRTNECVLTMNHGFPVEDVISLPGQLLVSAGDNQLKIWDLANRGRLVHTFSNHQKTITSLTLDRDATRLLSASLDGHVKVYELVKYSVTHTLKFGGPILSVALSPDSMTLAVGMVDGTLHMRRRTIAEEKPAVPSSAKRPRTGSFRYFNRGLNYTPTEDDFKVDVTKKKKLRIYDILLKKFEHREALESALQAGDPLVITSVLEELMYRDALRTTIVNPSENLLKLLISFLIKYVPDPRYSVQLVDVTNVTLDICIPLLGQSPTIDELFLKLKERIDEETTLQEKMISISGALSLIQSAALASSDPIA